LASIFLILNNLIMKSFFTLRQFQKLKSAQNLKHGNPLEYLFQTFKVCFFLTLIVISSNSFAQTFPPASSCTSKDLSLVAATLPYTKCETCTGSTVTKALTLAINNKTGSTRTSFAFWATLQILNSDGSIASTTAISKCFSTIPKNATTSYLYGDLTFSCGQSLVLTDIWEAWTDASPNSTCPTLLGSTSTINPKCGTLPMLNIVAGDDANYNITNATCTSLGSIQVLPFGGTGPYKVAIGNNAPVSVAIGGSVTFPNLAAGTYQFSITDANNCAAVVQTRTVTSTGSVATPAATVTQPTCSVATATVNVTSPVNGVTYTLTQSGIVKYTAASNGSFSSVIPGTYGLTASNGTCSSNGNNVTVNEQPGTPATPAASVTQPTCTESTATVNVTSPVNGITYTLTQSGEVKYTAASDGSFSSVIPGTYGLTASNGTCSSNGNDVTVNTLPAVPDAPSICVTQPSLCGPATGSVTILSPLGAGLQYSVDNGTTWQSSASFNNLAAGSVTGIKVKNADGCISSSVSCDASNCEASQAISMVESSVKIANEQTTVKAYPNPFNNQVKFVVNVAHAGNGTLEVFNSLGQKVKTVYQGYLSAGVNNFNLNLPDQKNASLIYRFNLGTKLVTGKLLQLKQ
jgi:hypothetical protein